jgi:tetratricopeptide (TPR) repeat protein
VAAHQRGDLYAAVTGYAKAVAADPSFSNAHYNLAIAYQANGQLDKALDHYEWALLTNPTHNEARFNYAIVLQQQEYFPDAIREMELLLKSNPKDTTLHLSLATMYARNRATYDKARRHYQDYLRYTPDKNSVIARDIRAWLDKNR